MPIPPRSLAAQGLALPEKRSLTAAAVRFMTAADLNGGTSEGLSRPFAQSVWVQRAIKTVSGPVSSAEVDIYPVEGGGRRTENGGRKHRHHRNLRSYRTSRGPIRRGTDEELELPEFELWRKRPGVNLTWCDLVDATVGWLKLAGESFWLLPDTSLEPFRNASPLIPQVLVARPDRLQHVVDAGKLIGWVFTDAAGRRWNLLTEQVIHCKSWNPYDDFRGLGEYESARIAADSDYLAGKFARNLNANSGDTGPYIIAKSGVPSDPQREQIVADLRAKRAAQLRGEFRPVFLTGDIAVEDPQIRSLDAGHISARLENRHEIFLAFGVPPSMADVRAAYSIGSASDFYRLITDTCIPAGDRLADALGELIGRTLKLSVEALLCWDEHPVMQEVRRERLASADGLWSKGMPLQSVSEYLSLGLPEFPGCDQGFLGMGLSPIEEIIAGPAPAEDPALAEDPVPPAPDDAPPAEDLPADPAADPASDLRPPSSDLRAIFQQREQQRAASGKALWESHMKARRSTVRSIQNRVSRLLMQTRREVLAGLAQFDWQKAAGDALVRRGLLDLIFNAHNFTHSLKVILADAGQGALETAAKQLSTELGLRDPWKMPPQAALDFVRSREGALEKVADTLRDTLNETIETGFKDGKGIAGISDDIRAKFNSLQRFEAQRIAITESGLAFNTARQEGMKACGVKYKRWLSSHGPHVRPSHRQAEADYAAIPIPVDQAFRVGGYDLMHPGDPNGPAKEIINCQCVAIAVKVKENQ
jgi:hypothetical protein